MYTITAYNASEALYLAKQALFTSGVEVDTRNGKALEFPEPVSITYKNPMQRVIFYPERDANPFFHLMESLWMLAGNNDVKFVDEFNGKINSYSDNGVTFWGAYGHRWRQWFGRDQLETAVMRLQTYPNDRRTVVGMWDPRLDLLETNGNKDLPCNTHIYFSVRNEKLNMTVCNRSNDLIWGAIGANVVHMSILQEYMAARIGVGMGEYVQFSNNLHAYVETLDKIKYIQPEYDPYLTLSQRKHGTLAGTDAPKTLHYTPISMVDEPEYFDEELRDWISKDYDFGEHPVYQNTFLTHTADPMKAAWRIWKNGDWIDAMHMAEDIYAQDWRVACLEWLERRKK
jgi:hypothetical protein